jgi:hypothetical protein
MGLSSIGMLGNKGGDGKDHVVVFMNTTTQTEVVQPNKVKIIEMGDDWMATSAPKASCAQGHNLIFHILSKENFKKLPRSILKTTVIQGAISISAQVTDVVTSDSTTNLIRVKFTQFIEKEWKELLSAQIEKQTSVDNLFKNIKS